MKNLIHIENRSGNIALTEVVTPDSIDRLIVEINRLYGNEFVQNNATLGEITCKADDALETIHLEIHSPGGSVMDGARLYHAIKEMRGRGVRVVATINTLAASMASVIAMAADEIRIVPVGRIMIHEASQVVVGNAEDHERAARNLNEISNEIAQIYAERTGGEVGDIRELMKRETWMTAGEAIERKFADKLHVPGVDTKNKGEPAPNAMGLFSKSEDQQAAIVALESENSKIREEFVALQSTAAESAQRVVALRADLEAASIELSEMKDASEQTAKELQDAKGKLSTFDAEVDKAAIAKVAAMGIKTPLSEIDDNSTGEKKTRAEFEALSHKERNAFIEKGGKIIP